jgi:hypothetical protein
MKKKTLEILTEVKNGTKSPKVAQKQLLDLFDVINMLPSEDDLNNEFPLSTGFVTDEKYKNNSNMLYKKDGARFVIAWVKGNCL